MNHRLASVFVPACLALLILIGSATKVLASGTRFWVGGTGVWDASTTDHWSETSGGAGGASVPSSSDNVVFDAASHTTSYTVTVAAAVPCANLTMTNPASGALRIAGNAPLTVFGNFAAPLGGIWSHTGTVTFAATSTGKTITSNGITFGGPVIWDGVGGGWVFQDAFAQSSTALNTNRNGIMDTNGQSAVFGSMALGAGSKTIVFGASTVTVRGPSVNFSDNNAGFTFDAGTSALIFDKVAAGALVVALGGNVFHDVSVVRSTSGFTATGSGTFHNFTMDSRILGAGNRVLTIDSGATWTVNGVFTYIGYDAAQNRGRFRAVVLGVPANLVLGESGSVVFTNIDLADIAITGASTPVSGTSVGDCGGNSGITMTPSVTRYWVGDTGVMSSSTHWSATSGGAPGATVPLPQDTAIWDAHSFTMSDQRVDFDLLRIGTMDFSQVTNHPSLNYVNPLSSGHLVFGSVIYSPNMSITVNDAATGRDALNLNGRGSYVYSGAGLILPANFTAININTPGGIYTLSSNLFLDSTRTLNVVMGTFDAAAYDVSAGFFTSSNTNTRTVKMGTGTWSITGIGTVWNVVTSSGMNFLPGFSTLKFTNTSTSTKMISAGVGAATFNTIWLTGDGSGSYVFSLPITAITFKDDNHSAHTIQFLSGATYTFTVWQVNGGAGNFITLASTSEGSFFELVSRSTNPFQSIYVSLKDSHAREGAGFYAGKGSVDMGGNNGWIFADAPEVVAPPENVPSVPNGGSGGGATSAGSSSALPVTFIYTNNTPSSAGPLVRPIAGSMTGNAQQVTSRSYVLANGIWNISGYCQRQKWYFCTSQASRSTRYWLDDRFGLRWLRVIVFGKKI